MEKKIISILAAVLAVVLVVVAVLFIQAKQTAGQLQQQQAEMAAEIEALTADADAKAAEIEALTADADAKAAEIEALTADADAKAAEIDALTADADAKAAEIDALNADVADKNSQIDALSADVADKSSQIDALNADAADKAGQIEALNADVAGKNSQIDALSADSADKDAAIESLTAELEQMRQANAKPEIPDSVPGEYSTTREFLYMLDQAGLIYTYNGVDGYNEESATIAISCGGHPTSFRFSFTSDCEEANLRVWDVITYSSQREDAVRAACDELNAAFRFATFHLEGDNTVTMTMDFIIRDDGSAGDIVFEGLLRAHSILGDAYTTLELYGW